MTFTDTHCHIHESSYKQAQLAWRRATDAGVNRLICVGTDQTTSAEAVKFVRKRENTWATVGLHPHDATNGASAIDNLRVLLEKDKADKISKNVHVGKIVAIGECGLDYFYNNSPREQQIAMFEPQLQLALDYDLPVSFHVRDAKITESGSVWDDFWPIFDSFKGLRGVLHSFTDNMSNMGKGLARGLYIGVNGISTFTKDESQVEMFRAIPVDRLLFETDAPFLTPHPHRGKVNEPAFITHVAQHVANLRSISLEELSRATERNATHLFFKNT